VRGNDADAPRFPVKHELPEARLPLVETLIDLSRFTPDPNTYRITIRSEARDPIQLIGRSRGYDLTPLHPRSQLHYV
jgi:hypothetical protein